MKKKLTALFLVLAMVATFFAGCGNSGSTDEAASTTGAGEQTTAAAAEGETLEATEVNLFIAASLEDAFKEIIPLYNETQPNVTITYNADSSGTLMTQIQEGYECDIFFSADTKQMDTLEQDGLVVDGQRKDLLNNEVVVIAGKDNGTKVTGLADMNKAESIALADGSVPVGKYTRTAMVNAGILDETDDPSAITTQDIMDKLGTEINECANVSKVKEAVKEGSCEVGTVYYTDAYSVLEDVDILEHISKDLTGDIVYPVGLINNTEADELQSQAAADFYEFIQSEQALAVFEKYLYTINQ
ncbi:MAG: molybdate ABC transporter substrate-binding protein [Lachnospiraceae bacterium]|nr:molybdate ABC transporter substrate-binding protein [Lachnospiraceae bacterium]